MPPPISVLGTVRYPWRGWLQIFLWFNRSVERQESPLAEAEDRRLETPQALSVEIWTFPQSRAMYPNVRTNQMFRLNSDIGIDTVIAQCDAVRVKTSGGSGNVLISRA